MRGEGRVGGGKICPGAGISSKKKKKQSLVSGFYGRKAGSVRAGEGMFLEDCLSGSPAVFNLFGAEGRTL